MTFVPLSREELKAEAGRGDAYVLATALHYERRVAELREKGRALLHALDHEGYEDVGGAADAFEDALAASEAEGDNP